MLRTAAQLVLGMWLVLAPAPLCHAGRGHAPVPTKSYTDAVGGLSLHYPAVWTFSKDASSYFPHVIAPGGGPVQAVFSFSPQGNDYEHTTLTGLQFLYRRQDAKTPSACESILMTNQEVAKLEHLTIRGVPFARLSTGEAGMMKSESQEAYATWRGGTCYLFEEDLGEIGKGTDDEKTRNLTASEVRALRRHLKEILESVTFSAPRPAPAGK